MITIKAFFRDQPADQFRKLRIALHLPDAPNNLPVRFGIQG